MNSRSTSSKWPVIMEFALIITALYYVSYKVVPNKKMASGWCIMSTKGSVKIIRYLIKSLFGKAAKKFKYNRWMASIEMFHVLVVLQCIHVQITMFLISLFQLIGCDFWCWMRSQRHIHWYEVIELRLIHGVSLVIIHGTWMKYTKPSGVLNTEYHRHYVPMEL